MELNGGNFAAPTPPSDFPNHRGPAEEAPPPPASTPPPSIPPPGAPQHTMPFDQPSHTEEPPNQQPVAEDPAIDQLPGEHPSTEWAPPQTELSAPAAELGRRDLPAFQFPAPEAVPTETTGLRAEANQQQAEEAYFGTVEPHVAYASADSHQVDSGNPPVAPPIDRQKNTDQLDDGGSSKLKLGLVASLVALVTVGGFLFILASGGEDATEAETAPTNPAVAAPAGPAPEVAPEQTTTSLSANGDLIVGWPELLERDCTPDRLLDGTSVDQITVVSCDNPHTFEVYAVATPYATGTAFPGADAVRTEADTQCAEAFAAFYGAAVGTAGLQFITLYPQDELSWERSQMITCLIGDVAQTERTGSLSQAGA